VDQLKAILRIKLKLAFRMGAKNASEIIFRIILVIFFAILLLSLSTALGFFFRNAEPDIRGHIFPAAHWIMCFIWLVIPFSPLGLNQSLHFEGLALLPIPRRTFVGALVINSLVGLNGVFIPLIIILVPIVFGRTPIIGLAAFIISVIFWIGLLITGQLILLAFGRILASRRFADIAIVVGAIAGFLIYTSRIFLYSETIENPDLAQKIVSLKPFAVIFDFFPPGLAGWAFNSVDRGDFTGAILPLGLLVIQLVLLAILAGKLIEKFFVGELTLGSAVKSREIVTKEGREPSSGSSFARGLLGIISSTLGLCPRSIAIVAKEWRYLFREPIYKVRFLNSVMMIVYLIALFLFLGRNKSGFATFGNYILPLFAYLSVVGELRLAVNKFGMDGQAIECLLLSPVSRTKLMLAKTVFGIGVFQGINILIIILAAVLLKMNFALAVLCVLAMAVGALVVEAWGNILSVYFPYKMATTSGRRGQAQFETGGCTFQFIYLLATFVTNAFALPMMALIVVPFFFGNALIGFALAPVSFLLAIWMIKYSMEFAAQKLVEREKKIIELLSRQTQ